MGCASSRPKSRQRASANAERVPEISLVDLETAQLKNYVRRRSSVDSLASVHRSSARSLTSSGYMSDIVSGSPRISRAHAFIRSHNGLGAANDLHQKYDTADAVVLGRGSCGSVVAVRHRQTEDMFAMKVVNVETMGGSLRELKQELDIQSQLDHPNIAKVFESYIDEENGEMAIIMEMCTGGSLVQRVCESDHGFDERAAATLVEKILSATIYCHHHGVVHRDIKLDNFIYENESSESELKLIDFGFACEIQSGGEEAMWDRLGSPSYMAPELYDEGTIYDSSVDMWAIGVVAYMLLSGKRPFHHADPRVKADQIRNDPLRFSERQWEHVSDDAKDFCLQLMQKRPRDRLSATAARDHRWIQHTSSVHAIADASHGRFQRRFQSVSVIQSLNAFTEADDLKKLALEVIAFSTPPSKLKELREMFVKIDVDDSGTLSLDEFKAAMALHPDVPQDRVEQIFNTMDHEGSGEVDYSMFLSAMLGRRRSLVSNTNSIMAAFTTLDTDGASLMPSRPGHPVLT